MASVIRRRALAAFVDVVAMAGCARDANVRHGRRMGGHASPRDGLEDHRQSQENGADCGEAAHFADQLEQRSKN